MFLVLVLHSGFATVKSPTTPEVHEQFLQPFARFLFESLSIACVDIFVLISGWFGIRPTKKGLLNFLFQNLFGISESLNWYSWFVALYIFCMIVLPLIYRWLDEKPMLATIGLSLAFYVLEVGIHTLPFWNNNKWVASLFTDCMLMPTVLLGYYFAKQQVFQMIQVPKHWVMAIAGLVMIVLALIVRACCGSIVGFDLDIIYAPLSIIGILIIFNSCKLSITSKVLTALGNLSVYMWFFHALFFTDVVRTIYQPFILVSNNIFIITLWTVMLTFACSWILEKMVYGVEHSFPK